MKRPRKDVEATPIPRKIPKKLAKPMFTITSWNIVGLWSYKNPRDNCVICQSNVMDICTECQSTAAPNDVHKLAEEIYMRPDNQASARVVIEDLNQALAKQQICPIAWGKCKHYFHRHCIEKWLKTRHICPLDNGVWEYQSEPL